MGDPDLDAIVFARGGYGCGRILEDLDFSPLKSRPKLFLGYSDLTAFYAALQRATGIAGFYGPMVLNYNRPGKEFRERALWSVLERRPGWNRFRLSRRAALREGSGEGKLVGGCLSLLISLLGTPFDLDTRGAILFWEEVDEEPYRIDRMLNQLRMAGKFRELKGMVVGKLERCGPKGKTPGLPLPEILSDHLRGPGLPSCSTFPRATRRASSRFLWACRRGSTPARASSKSSPDPTWRGHCCAGRYIHLLFNRLVPASAHKSSPPGRSRGKAPHTPHHHAREPPGTESPGTRCPGSFHR